ncbi:MAG: biotin--[Bacteroidaceae bacterium]|nr:biotin--[acetyl-CoA-carboxylase] ligase [Bacteroidaceae bacterium]MBQ9192086.1 biotin--[acetyl-CoA-carboxylase] ligase [Bacteroidaceae bacterium]
MCKIVLDSSPSFRYIELDETASTNSFLADYRPLQPAELTLVSAEYQTAGRGQTGNSWESAAGQNLLFSLLLHPVFLPPTRLFLLSEAIALSIRDALGSFLDGQKSLPEGCPDAISVKWPNDIYVGDRKIGGILIENELSGSRIGRCIIGCGVNINQPEFHSDAPNPVSLRQLLGRDTPRPLVLDAIITRFRRHYAALEAQADAAATLHASYLAALYRRTGMHPYREASSSTPFLAEIADVETSGHLVLRDEQGCLRRYAFKEVAFVH